MQNSATLFISGLLLTAALAGCGGGGSGGETVGSNIIKQPENPPSPDATLNVAVPGSLYSSVLVDCVTAETVQQSCSLNTLPLLAQDAPSPSIDQIMARTVVSHDWMSARFRQVLERMPPDVITLLRAVTAVVIASDIRPSNYFPLTGAIYIDPADLWLTNPEKATISRDEDYRSDFGADLNFVSLTRSVIGTEYAWKYFPLDGNEIRSLNDILLPMAALLFHELMHANDVFHPSAIVNLNPNQSVLIAWDALFNNSVSVQLDAFQPLTSQLWINLAAVLYGGQTASAAQRSLLPQQVGFEFENDGANDDYAFSSIFEDPAMLVEEVMMQYHYGVEREIAYTDTPTPGLEQFCSSYTVRWGFRNRTGHALVKARAELALQLLFGRSDVSAYLANLSPPRRMTNNVDWCDIQTLNARPNESAKQSGRTQQAADESLQRLRPDDRRPRHR